MNQLIKSKDIFEQHDDETILNDEMKKKLELMSNDLLDLERPCSDEEDDHIDFSHNNKKRKLQNGNSKEQQQMKKIDAWNYSRNNRLKKIESYKLWLKHAPILYDYVGTHVLTWTALSIQWMPDTNDSIWLDAIEEGNDYYDEYDLEFYDLNNKNDPKDYTTHRLLLGTYALDQKKDEIIVASIQLPKERSDEKDYLKRLKEAEKEQQQQGTSKQEDYEGEELNSHKFNVRPIVTVPNFGEIKRLKYMPQDSNVVASWNIDGTIHLNFLKQKLKKIKNRNEFPIKAASEPFMKLKAHKKDGYALNWSKTTEGLLASGGDDASIFIWDVNASLEQGKPLVNLKPINSKHNQNGHKDIVSDLSFHPTKENLMVSVSDDKTMLLWDLRTVKNGPSQTISNMHDEVINCVALNEKHIASGSSDKTVKIFDERKLSEFVYELKSCHKNDVLQVKWHPTVSNIVSSSSADGILAVWDLNKPLNEELEKNFDDESSEDSFADDDFEPIDKLLFVHGGHTDKIGDFDWLDTKQNNQHKFTMASTAEDNILQISKMNSKFTSKFL